VDRPPVNFHELNAIDQDPNDPDPYNIYSNPSWRAVLDLTRDETDRIVIRDLDVAWSSAEAPTVLWDNPARHLAGERLREDIWEEDGHRFVRTTVAVAGRELTSMTRRDRDVDTIWVTEHLLKELADLRAWLQLPEPPPEPPPDTRAILECETTLGDTGIVMISTPDPLCEVAPLFSMEDYTITALFEQDLFDAALTKAALPLYRKVQALADALPGRFWRIYGPEYASPPHLPPSLFAAYVVRYVTPMIDIIHRSGGKVRIHSHGNVRDILDMICATGCDALDPVEPPPHGDVTLEYAGKTYGDQLTFFGNLEACDIENCPTNEFREIVKRTCDAGISHCSKGFVLMPSASPYGRVLSERALRNYETMVAVVANL
jgi:hypothetical protein